MISKLPILCFLAVSIALFLNPQQTKYFGGLGVNMKQAGLFTHYKTAESFVYVLSWILISSFCFVSVQASRFF